VVFCGLFPVDAADFEKLRESISKLRLNDASFSFEMETSAALGFGFRCGFLGLLHLEIIQERLTREYDLDLITTAPSVVYKIKLTHGGGDDRAAQPGRHARSQPDREIEEPWIEAVIYVPDEYLGSILKLCQDRRGIQKNLTYVGGRAQVTYELPLNEVVFDFYDRLKSIRRAMPASTITRSAPRGRPRQDGHPGQRRAGRRAEHDRPPRHRRSARTRHVRAAEGPDPAPSVQDPDPGGDRRQGDRARDDQRDAQGRHREMLWRRRQPQAKLLDKQKKGKKRRCANMARSASRRRRLSRRCGWGQNWQENWAPWPKWLALKLKGSLSEWGLLPEGEQEMARRLIEADDHFWEEGERNPASINATIAEWIAEISAEDALGSNKRSVDFFISYTESDEAMAREVSTVLEGAGYSTFLQFKDMPSGSNFIIEMDRGLSISKGFIPLYSPAYFKSDFCRQELAAAMALDPIGEKRFIRALLLEPTELPMLARQIVYRNLAGLGVNARTTVIHELADYVRRPQLREEVAAHAQEIISPKPVETEAGKIAVTPNPDYDVPANPQDFLDPGRQITGLLKALLRSLDANAPKLMLNNLVEYEEELRTKGASASWGKLDRLMHYAEMSFQGADPREFESGVAEQFRDILGLHAMLGTELPRADEKFNKLADTEIDENASGPAITAPMQSIEHAAEALRAEGITEPSFDRTAEEIVRNGRDVAYESEPRSLPQIDPTDPTALDHVGVPAVSSKKAAIIASLGFALTLYDLLGTTVSIADSATVVTVMRYLRSAIDALMALLG
jgi:hypothetical protein